MAESLFRYEIHIRATLEQVWEGLTSPGFTPKYWVGTTQDCTWEQGAPWKLMIPDGRVGDAGEVLEIDAPRRVVLSWRNEFQPDLKEEGYSRMTWELEPQEGSVKLTVDHRMDRENSKLIEGVAGGWPMILSSLKSLLETGESLDGTREWPEGY